MPLGIIVGMAAEARVARRAGVARHLGEVAIGGGTPAGAEAAAERLIARGATALLSFGLAGGLDPHLRPGSIVVPVAVLEQNRRTFTDEALCRALGGTTASLLLAADAAVADADAKRRLSARTGASAVDLESGAVARVAQRHRLPFAVLRAVCDPAQRSLPPAALAALDAGGAIRLARVLRSVAVRPWQIPALLRLALDAALARRALVRAASGLRRRLIGGMS
jgi:adenosylhomocysteine nucleosidase